MNTKLLITDAVRHRSAEDERRDKIEQVVHDFEELIADARSCIVQLEKLGVPMGAHTLALKNLENVYQHVAKVASVPKLAVSDKPAARFNAAEFSKLLGKGWKFVGEDRDSVSNEKLKSVGINVKDDEKTTEYTFNFNAAVELGLKRKPLLLVHCAKFSPEFAVEAWVHGTHEIDGVYASKFAASDMASAAAEANATIEGIRSGKVSVKYRSKYYIPPGGEIGED